MRTPSKPSSTPRPPGIPAREMAAVGLAQPGHGAGAPGFQVVVPIRSLGVNHRERIGVHLLALDARDRYMRFGHVASDAQILRYVHGLDFQRDEVFGIYNRRLRLIAMAHLAYGPADPARPKRAEFGVSVAASARGRGFGTRLFERAAMHARNDGVSQMHIHALSDNTAMLKIARAAGASVRRDGSESEAYLCLPAPTFDSQMAEMVQEHFAQVDYGVKTHTQPLLRWIARTRPEAASGD